MEPQLSQGTYPDFQSVPERVGEYDVFISHCGLDCKRDFAIWLKIELERVGLECFFDELSLDVGDNAADKMLEAMDAATYGVVILSPGFLEQEWCLKELQTFVNKGRILPIYLNGFEAVENAKKDAAGRKVWDEFKRFVRTEDEYLKAVSPSYTGLRLEALDGWWSTCIRRARDEMLRLLGKHEGGVRLTEEDLLVGQHEHLVELKKLLGVEQQCAPAIDGAASGAGAREVGIVGMGGVGKSTMAKMLYDDPDVRGWFGGNLCFLKVGPNPSDGAICEMQKKILKDLCDIETSPGSPEEGRALIRRALHGRRVFICLDDVWGEGASEVVRKEDVGAGSCILKTSRVKEGIAGEAHALEVLDVGPARELLCWHAFGEDKPPEELVVLAEKAAETCGRLPLAIRILGRQLAGERDQRGFLMQFLKRPTNADAVIRCREIIKSSFDHLPLDPPRLRDAFVLIGGLWPGTVDFRAWDNVLQHLAAAVYGDRDHSEEMAETALKKLSSRSLIKLEESEDGLRITVHDLVVDTATSLENDLEQAERKFCYWRAGDAEPEVSRSVKWRHLRVSRGKVSTGLLTAPNSSILSLIGEGLPEQDLPPLFSKLVQLVVRESQPKEPSPCRLLIIERGQVPRLQPLSQLQCLRLRSCKFDWALEPISNLKKLSVLELSNCGGECIQSHLHLPKGRYGCC
jgi:hypothetical protein